MSQEANITQHKWGKVPRDEDVRYIEKVINFWPKSDEYWAYRHLWYGRDKESFFIIIITAIRESWTFCRKASFFFGIRNENYEILWIETNALSNKEKFIGKFLIQFCNIFFLFVVAFLVYPKNIYDKEFPC